jgi:hypothetical protein
LRAAGVAAPDALAAGRGRWPFPEAAFADAIGNGYAALAHDPDA